MLEARPQEKCRDKGYDEEVRACLQAFDVTAHIRPCGEEAKALQAEAGFEGRSCVVDGHMRS